MIKVSLHQKDNDLTVFDFVEQVFDAYVFPEIQLYSGCWSETVLTEIVNYKLFLTKMKSLTCSHLC